MHYVFKSGPSFGSLVLQTENKELVLHAEGDMQKRSEKKSPQTKLGCADGFTPSYSLDMSCYVWVMKSMSSDFPADEIKESTMAATSVVRLHICAGSFQKFAHAGLNLRLLSASCRSPLQWWLCHGTVCPAKQRSPFRKPMVNSRVRYREGTGGGNGTCDTCECSKCNRRSGCR